MFDTWVLPNSKLRCSQRLEDNSQKKESKGAGPGTGLYIFFFFCACETSLSSRDSLRENI